MGCTLAENRPLSLLRHDLGIDRTCHSRRPSCTHGLSQDRTETAMGAPGAVLGYCQALFSAAAAPDVHTRKVTLLLRQIDAPWAQSHELFWGYRGAASPAEYVTRSMEPLLGDGRVPILITGLDPGRDMAAINEILASPVPVAPDETVLLRLVLRDETSIVAVGTLLRALLSEARRVGAMPRWWPLLQADFSVEQWQAVRASAGEAWAYANVAVNPFSDPRTFDACAAQVTVAQVVVGARGCVQGQDVHVPAAMRILGTTGDASYSLPQFLQELRSLPVVPTLILLGPSQTAWSDSDDQTRVREVLRLLRQGCDELWKDLSPKRRETVWSLSA